ncbi:MAG: hypothetical protein R2854_17395 [Caldilineaceae bacterium]
MAFTGARRRRSIVRWWRPRPNAWTTCSATCWRVRRLGQNQTAYGAARFLVRKDPHVLPAWVVIAATGDENDRALALNPRTTISRRRVHGAAPCGWSMPCRVRMASAGRDDQPRNSSR